MGYGLAETSVLSALIAPIVAELGFELVRVQLNGSKATMTLQVMAEDPATGQMTLAQCASVSRALSEMLDVEDPIEGEYALEVSSPGIDRPLTRLSDFAKWVGHEVRLKLEPPVDTRKRLHGSIVGIDGDNVQFAVPTIGAVSVPFAAIVGAKLVLTNRLIHATRPATGDLLNADDADDIYETGPDLGNDDLANDNDTEVDED